MLRAAEASLSATYAHVRHLNVLLAPNVAWIAPQRPHVLDVYASSHTMTLHQGYSSALFSSVCRNRKDHAVVVSVVTRLKRANAGVERYHAVHRRRSLVLTPYRHTARAERPSKNDPSSQRPPENRGPSSQGAVPNFSINHLGGLNSSEAMPGGCGKNVYGCCKSEDFAEGFTSAVGKNITTSRRKLVSIIVAQ